MRKKSLSIITILIICFVSACGLKSDITEKSIYHQISEFHDGTKVFVNTQKEEPEPEFISYEDNVVTVEWDGTEWSIVYREGSYEERKEEVSEHIRDDYGNSFVAIYDGGGEATAKINDNAYVSIPFSSNQDAIKFASHVSYEFEGVPIHVIPEQRELPGDS